MKTNLKELILEQEYQTISDAIQETRTKVVNLIIRKNLGELLNEYAEIGREIAFLESISLTEETPLSMVQNISKCLGVLTEMYNMVKTFIRQDRSMEMLETIKDLKHPFKIMNKLYFEPLPFEELVTGLSESYGVADEDEILNEIIILINCGLVLEDDTLTLSHQGTNIFDIYKVDKKYTNTYERIKRKESGKGPTKVNVQLLEKINHIENAFGLLSMLYYTADYSVYEEDIAIEFVISEDQVDELVSDLSKFKLVTRGGDNLVMLTTYGSQIFKLYKTSKQYTNKYETLRRKSK